MRGHIFLQGLVSFLIVSFGQPSFAPWLGSIAAALGYALFWRAIRIYPFLTQRFWRASVWYASVSLIQLSWMSSIEFQGIYILAVWIALSIWLGLQFGLLSILIPYNRKLTLPRILAIASIWTLLEWSRFHILCGYSWNLSGLALSYPCAIQVASIFGVLGLSFWVIFVNLLGLRAFTRKGIFRYVVWIGATCLPYALGMAHIAFRDAQMEKKGSESSLSCLLVQTGLLPPEKTLLQGKIRSFISPYDQWKRILVFLNEKKGNQTDLIVLPEAAVPFSSEINLYDPRIVEQIFLEVLGPEARKKLPSRKEEQKVSNLFWAQAVSNTFDADVILGLDHVDEDGHSYNSAFHAKPNNTSFNRYDKRVLMPLAEYLPFSWLAPLVKSYGITDSFTHGKEARIFSGKIPLSVSICYEETFPKKIREGRLKGAKMLVNVTNDGWYPNSRLPSQHFEHAKFRAIENGSPLVRACNTGITASIDALGRTVDKLQPYMEGKKIQSGALFTQINTYEYPTLYTLWGNWGIVSLSFLFIGIFAALKKELNW